VLLHQPIQSARLLANLRLNGAIQRRQRRLRSEHLQRFVVEKRATRFDFRARRRQCAQLAHRCRHQRRLRLHVGRWQCGVL
jgi:hypothetical protein